MAFVRSGFRGIGGHNRSFVGGQRSSYVNTDDSFATMMVPGYFDAIANAFGTDDYIDLIASDGAQIVQVVNGAIPTTMAVSNNNHSVQTLTGAGAVDLIAAVTELVGVTGTDALTLADGAVNQEKIITLINDTGVSTLTPVSGLGYSTIAFADLGDTVWLKFLTGGWAMVGHGGSAGGPVATV